MLLGLNNRVHRAFIEPWRISSFVLSFLQATVKRRFVTNVAKTATNNSNRVAVIDNNGSYSYNQIYVQAQLIAGQLDAKPGLIFMFFFILKVVSV